MNNEQLIVERGRIIAKFVEIESTVDWIVQTVLFHGDPPLWFLKDLLANEHYSFALRMSVLDRTLEAFEGRELLAAKPRNKLLQEIRAMAGLRNIFAHAGHRFGEAPAGGLYFHPKKPTFEAIDWVELSKTFEDLESRVGPELAKLAKHVSDLYERD